MARDDKLRDTIGGADTAAEGSQVDADRERQARHELDREAAGRPDVASAGLGAALSGEGRANEQSETALSLKRAAGNARRV